MNRSWPSLVASLAIFAAIIAGVGWATLRFGSAPLIEEASAGAINDRH